ncbi:hemerythrin domain-containing protein [Kitasatospora sp. NPDC048365]|uniref:hemerythrin domain-containing protein n=1 Tax=Kitasatospora sp. NPDC048365 TaxID=3364050 RepID=UPI00371840F8
MSTDAIVLLREDHHALRQLFRDYLAPGTTDAARAEDAERIVHELTVHNYLEDEVVYPEVRRQVPELADPMRVAQQEHHVADLLCQEIAVMDEADPQRDAKLRVLIEVVSRHLDAEEHDWFPRVRTAIGRNELRRIGERMQAVRETAPREPEKPGLLRRFADALES